MKNLINQGILSEIQGLHRKIKNIIDRGTKHGYTRGEEKDI